MMRLLLISISILLFSDLALAETTEKSRLLQPRTGQITTYDTQGNIIDFLDSGQDGEYQRGGIWPEPRFQHNGDGTVTDKLTRLMWIKDGNCFGSMGWHLAKKTVSDFNIDHGVHECHDYSAEYSDWSVPSLGQLAGLINAEEAVSSDYLKLEGITDMQPDVYWTSSNYMNPLNAWSVDFSDGSIHYKVKMEKHLFLPVRQDVVEPIKLEKDEQKNVPLEDKDDNAITPLKTITKFVDNGDGTISDSTSGLMWLKDAGCFSGIKWKDSIAAISGLNKKSGDTVCREYTADYTDWTLPNRIELRSIIDYDYDFPALVDKHPFVSLAESYWTSTTDAASPEKSFVVNLFYGAVTPFNKTSALSAWPVRSVVSAAIQLRKVSSSSLGSEIDEKFIIRIDSELHTEVHWPPAPRFFDNGDGSSLDRVTGYTWLTDGNCFGKLGWEETFKTMEKFNGDPRGFDCIGYEGTFSDWMVPTAEDLSELLNKKEKDSAAWLNSQGVTNIQSTGDYWSSTPTLINLYYAYVINFKNGKFSNYPQSLSFFFWPRRILPVDPNREPLLNITVNAIGDAVTLAGDTPFSVGLYLHTFGIRTPSDFWVWYESPEGKQLWLSAIRTWKSEMTPVYQGNLFNLKNYEVIRSRTNELAAGDYTLHFAVDFTKNGILDELRYENKVMITVE